MGVDDIVDAVSGGGGNVLTILIWGIVIIGALVIILGGLFAYWYFKKKWNLKVEIKLPRSDGKIIMGEWGRGYYDAKKGVVFIKRAGKGFKPIPMEVFDIRKYLQGADLLTVIQVASEDYRPVLNESWEEHTTTDADGNEIKESILNIKVDSGLNKAWKSAWDAAAKKAYSLQSFLTQFQTPIAIGIVILACFVGFAIIWTRLGSVC